MNGKNSRENSFKIRVNFESLNCNVRRENESSDGQVMRNFHSDDFAFGADRLLEIMSKTRSKRAKAGSMLIL